MDHFSLDTSRRTAAQLPQAQREYYALSLNFTIRGSLNGIELGDEWRRFKALDVFARITAVVAGASGALLDTNVEVRETGLNTANEHVAEQLYRSYREVRRGYYTLSLRFYLQPQVCDVPGVGTAERARFVALGLGAQMTTIVADLTSELPHTTVTMNETGDGTERPHRQIYGYYDRHAEESAWSDFPFGRATALRASECVTA